MITINLVCQSTSTGGEELNDCSKQGFVQLFGDSQCLLFLPLVKNIYLSHVIVTGSDILRLVEVERLIRNVITESHVCSHIFKFPPTGYI